MSGFLGFLLQEYRVPAEGSNAYVTITAADLMWLAPARPLVVVRWGFICTTTCTTTPPVFTLDLRPTVGSNTNRVTGATTTVASTQGYNAQGQPALFSDAAGGSLTTTTLPVAGVGVFHDMNPQTGSGSPALYPPYTVKQPEDTQLMVFPGQELVLKCATAPAAGAGILFIQARDLPVQYDRNVAGGTAQSAGSLGVTLGGPVPSLPYYNMTKYFS